jgi:predicted Zn-dependent protease
VAKAMQLDPGSIRARMVLGESFRIAERYDLAIEEFKAVVERKPDLALGWAGLAAAYSASGNDPAALNAAERAIALLGTRVHTSGTKSGDPSFLVAMGRQQHH